MIINKSGNILQKRALIHVSGYMWQILKTIHDNKRQKQTNKQTTTVFVLFPQLKLHTNENSIKAVENTFNAVCYGYCTNAVTSQITSSSMK